MSAALQRTWFTSTMRMMRWYVRMWNSRLSSKTFTSMGWGVWRAQVRSDVPDRSAFCWVPADTSAAYTPCLELLEILSLLGQRCLVLWLRPWIRASFPQETASFATDSHHECGKLMQFLCTVGIGHFILSAQALSIRGGADYVLLQPSGRLVEGAARTP